MCRTSTDEKKKKERNLHKTEVDILLLLGSIRKALEMKKKSQYKKRNRSAARGTR